MSSFNARLYIALCFGYPEDEDEDDEHYDPDYEEIRSFKLLVLDRTGRIMQAVSNNDGHDISSIFATAEGLYLTDYDGCAARKDKGLLLIPNAATRDNTASALARLVLDFFATNGEENETGCTVADAAQALANQWRKHWCHPLTPELVRVVVKRLASEGHLYSTIDDDHFKATPEA